jgi:hypothetical protein
VGVGLEPLTDVAAAAETWRRRLNRDSSYAYKRLSRSELEQIKWIFSVMGGVLIPVAISRTDTV